MGLYLSNCIPFPISAYICITDPILRSFFCVLDFFDTKYRSLFLGFAHSQLCTRFHGCFFTKKHLFPPFPSSFTPRAPLVFHLLSISALSTTAMITAKTQMRCIPSMVSIHPHTCLARTTYWRLTFLGSLCPSIACLCLQFIRLSLPVLLVPFSSRHPPMKSLIKNGDGGWQFKGGTMCYNFPVFRSVAYLCTYRNCSAIYLLSFCFKSCFLSTNSFRCGR